MNPAFSIFSSDKLVLHKLDYISQLYELLLQMLCSVIVCAHSRSCCLRKAPSVADLRPTGVASLRTARARRSSVGRSSRDLSRQTALKCPRGRTRCYRPSSFSPFGPRLSSGGKPQAEPRSTVTVCGITWSRPAATKAGLSAASTSSSAE